MLRKINTREVLIVLAISCCMGLVFNSVYKNGLPFIAQSKAELYAQKNIPTLSVEEAKTKFDRGDVLFLDARDPSDFQEGHIEAALNLPVRHFELYYPKMKKLLLKDAEIVVYCASRECNASLYLAEELVRSGYERIEVMVGGWAEWKEMDYPSE